VSTSRRTALFGLSRQQLRPVVERIAGEPLAAFGVRVEPQEWLHYGVRGDKAVVVFDWTARSGWTGSSRAFVKKQGDPVQVGGRPVEPRPVEAEHYRWLARHGAPIPRLYGALTVADPDEREILFVEHLAGVVTEGEPWAGLQSDADRFHRYLAAVARFSAIQPSGHDASPLPRPHRHFRHQMAGWERKLDALWRDAQDGRLGDELRQACADGGREQLRRLGARLRGAIGGMAQGLSAGDHEPFQSGWRESGEAVLFDLELVGFAPRFYDIAVTLGAPDDYCPRCRPGRELAEHYLAEYARFGGSRVPVEQLLAETRALWLAWTIGWIGYWHRPARDGRPDARRLLHRKLRCLLREAP